MREAAVIDVVSDASIALKWFHDEGEAEVDESRAVLAAHRDRKCVVSVLDLTAYEVGNALLRGRAEATAVQVAIVIEALAAICRSIQPERSELRLAADLAERHKLTLYDAAYAAVAAQRHAELVTLDSALLDAGLGRRPSDVVASLA